MTSDPDRPFNFEKYVPRNRAILFNDRLAVSARALFPVVREFFEPSFLLHQIEFGDKYCWMGFRTAQTGNEDHGWVRIETGLGVKEPEGHLYMPLDIPHITVGSVSIRSLSPIASRVIVRTDYTPEALSGLFNMLVQYLIWVVNGEESHEAYLRAVASNQVKVVGELDAGEFPRLPAPSDARDKAPDKETAPTDQAKGPKSRRGTSQPTDQAKGAKSRRGTSHKNTRQPSRGGTQSTGRPTKQRIYVPQEPSAFERYRKIWRIIRRTQREYLHPSNDTEESRPNPTLDELRDAIAEKLGKKYSEKTVRRVIQAGNAGLLKKK